MKKSKKRKRLEVLIVECQNRLYIENFKVEHIESLIDMAKYKKEGDKVDNYVLRKNKLIETIDELLDRLIALKKEEKDA